MSDSSSNIVRVDFVSPVNKRKKAVSSALHKLAETQDEFAPVAVAGLLVRQDGLIDVRTSQVEPEQVDAILFGLDRLRDVLIKYRDTAKIFLAAAGFVGFVVADSAMFPAVAGVIF